MSGIMGVFFYNQMEGVFYQTLGIGLYNLNYNMGWKNKAHDQD